MVKKIYCPILKYLSFVVILVLLLMQTAAAQQTGSIVGHVTDSHTGEALIGVNIIVKGTNLGAATNLNGNYKISNITVGEHTVIASYVGYQEKTFKVNILENKSVELNIKLNSQVIQGKEVVVTAQAKGQLSAINQQISSTGIVNVVSSEKMKELPDANIAESIGRLPGISLQRNAGEAYAVVVRGLSPQYNEVTIEGVPMASTNYYDRGIDLSLLSDNLIQGVEVSKTLQANMDANALGGTVNLTLRTADPGLHYNIWANGGYNHLRNSYDNYKFTASISDRFFNDRVGVLFEGNLEKKQLPSDQFNATYATPVYDPNTDQFSVSTQTAQLTDNTTKRNRYGLSLILDYKSSLVNVKFYNVFGAKVDSNITRDWQTQFNTRTFFNQAFINETRITQETHSLQALFKLGTTELPVSLSYTKSTQKVPNGLEFDFYQTSVPSAPPASQRIYGVPASLINTMGVWNPADPKSVLNNMITNNTNLSDEAYDAKIDWKVPFSFSDNFSGTISAGGKYHKVNRKSSRIQNFLYLPYGYGQTNRQGLISYFPFLKGDANTSSGIGAIPFVDKNYDRTSILGYPIGPGLSIYRLANMQNIYYDTHRNYYWTNGPNSYNQNYTDKESMSAGYIMATLNIGNNLSIVPGIRYQDETTDLSAYHININLTNQNGLQGNPRLVETKRNFSHWFPSVNIKYKATSNIQVRGAIYRSESLPSYGQITSLAILQNNTTVVTGNPLLKPSTAWNYDLGVSLFNNNIGLFTIDAFYKEISGLIYDLQNYYPFTSLSNNPYEIVAPQSVLNSVPDKSYYDTSYVKSISGEHLSATIPINDPANAFLRGISFSWQTHLWYLPGVLNGLVLDLNLTLMNSAQQYPFFNVVRTGGSAFNPKNTIYFQTVQAELQNQPKAIYNAIIGWDYEGFSARISFRYQRQTITSIDTKHNLENSFYGNVLLTDISLKQKLFGGLSLFANATNINNHVDNYYFSHPEYTNQNIVYAAGQLPTSGQTYGWAIELGATYSY